MPYMTRYLYSKLYLILLSLFFFINLCAQYRSVTGIVVNPFTREKIPYASLQWKKAGYGVITDSAGSFRITVPSNKLDTLQVSYVGFETRLLPVSATKDSLFLKIELGPLKS